MYESQCKGHALQQYGHLRRPFVFHKMILISNRFCSLNSYIKKGRLTFETASFKGNKRKAGKEGTILSFPISDFDAMLDFIDRHKNPLKYLLFVFTLVLSQLKQQ